MKVSFIYTFGGTESIFEKIQRLGQIIEYTPNAEIQLATMIIETYDLYPCLQLFQENNRIKQMNVWK